MEERPHIRKSHRELAHIIVVMRNSGLRWVAVAAELNAANLRRPGIDRAWTATIAADFLRSQPGYIPRLPGRPAFRPRHPANCRDWPCPWASCRNHLADLYLVADDRYDHRKPTPLMRLVADGHFEWMPYDCLIDAVLELGPVTSGAAMADLLQTTRERVRRMIAKAMQSASSADEDVGEELRKMYAYSLRMGARRRATPGS